MHSTPKNGKIVHTINYLGTKLTSLKCFVFSALLIPDSEKYHKKKCQLQSLMHFFVDSRTLCNAMSGIFK